MRNIEFGMLFSILRSLFDIKLFSVNQNNLNIEESDLIGQRMSKYLMGTVDSYLAEGYSQNISDATKKAVRNTGNVTTSRDGNKWGNSLKYVSGLKVEPNIESEIIDVINYYIKRSWGYDRIIKYIKDKFLIKVSTSYISTHRLI
jgi:hypothetical protein